MKILEEKNVNREQMSKEKTISFKETLWAVFAEKKFRLKQVCCK